MGAKQIDFLLAGIQSAGAPLGGGRVYTYESNLTTPKTCWEDKDKASAYGAYIPLDANGVALAYGDGLYGFIIKDVSGSTIYTWDDLIFRTDSSVVNVKDYGATGDGTTDDTAAVQAALTASQNIYFPAGTYLISTALTKSTTGGNFSIDGSGMDAILKWTGADYATMLTVTESGTAQSVRVKNVCFDLNNKAQTGLKIVGIAKTVDLRGMLFKEGKWDTSTTPVPAMLDIGTSTYAGKIAGNFFFSGTSTAINLNSAGAASGPVAWSITENNFMVVLGKLLYAKNVDNIEIANNGVDGSLTDAKSAGFDLDAASNIVYRNNYIESMYGFGLRINYTTVGSTTNSITVDGRNMFNRVAGTSGNDVMLYKTQNATIRDNSFIGHNVIPVYVDADAVNTCIGKNYAENGTIEVWLESFITNNSASTFFSYAMIPTFNAAAVLSLTNQSASGAWVDSAAISGIVTNVPATARGWVFAASIKSVTPGARLFVVGQGSVPLYSARFTDKTTQYVEAQVNGSYNTNYFIVPAYSGTSDKYAYAISDGGTTDTDVELRLTGYLMPN